MNLSSRHGLPRWVDVAIAAVILVAALPLLCLAALAIALTSRGPVIFRHRRAGVGGRPFEMLKFRTMRCGMSGPEVTAGADRRITPVGRFLRRTKIDELPELWNVIRGDMALVGPRPEALWYVDASSEQWREILGIRPGITHPVTLLLRNEEQLLAQVGADYESFYRRHLLPYKLQGSREYSRTRTWRTDLAVLWRTVSVVLNPAGTSAPSIADVVSSTPQFHF